jgi:hypothetical protein
MRSIGRVEVDKDIFMDLLKNWLIFAYFIYDIFLIK